MVPWYFGSFCYHSPVDPDTITTDYFSSETAVAVSALQRLLFRAVVVLGEIQRPSGELFEPVGRVLS